MCWQGSSSSRAATGRRDRREHRSGLLNLLTDSVVRRRLEGKFAVLRVTLRRDAAATAAGVIVPMPRGLRESAARERLRRGRGGAWSARRTCLRGGSHSGRRGQARRTRRLEGANSRRPRSAALEIESKALAWSVANASVAEIDANSIFWQATLLAMRRAVEQLGHAPAEVLIDGLHCPSLPYPRASNRAGDATVPEISAASILAKTARDRHMLDLDARYPEYGFARNKGYSTRDHLAALRRFGAPRCIARASRQLREVVYSLF